MSVAVGFPKEDSPFLNKVRKVIRTKRLGFSTKRSYLHYTVNYIYFHGKRHLETLGEAEVRAYLSHLAIEKQVAASTQNVALSALLFLYKQVLGRELGMVDALDKLVHNIRNAFMMIRAVLPELHKTHGNIVAAGSEAGLNGTPMFTPYGATKGWTHAFIKGVAMEQTKHGVRANCFCPGPIDTMFTNPEVGPINDHLHLCQLTALQRRAEGYFQRRKRRFAMPMTLSRIHHVGILVTDFDRSLAFYTKLLGKEPKINTVVEGISEFDRQVEAQNAWARVAFFDVDNTSVELHALLTVTYLTSRVTSICAFSLTTAELLTRSLKPKGTTLSLHRATLASATKT